MIAVLRRSESVSFQNLQELAGTINNNSPVGAVPGSIVMIAVLSQELIIIPCVKIIIRTSHFGSNYLRKLSPMIIIADEYNNLISNDYYR